MVTKFNKVWDVYIFPSAYENLVQFLSHLKKTDNKAASFAEKALERIKESCYAPVIIKFDNDETGDDSKCESDKILKKIEMSKATLFDDLMLLGQEALDNSDISAQRFMDFEAYVYDAKDKMNSKV